MKKEIVVALTLLIAFSPLSNANIVYLSCTTKITESPIGGIGTVDNTKYIIDLLNHTAEGAKDGRDMTKVDRVIIGESKIELSSDIPLLGGEGKVNIDRRTLELKYNLNSPGIVMAGIGSCVIDKVETGKKLKNKF